MQSGRTIHHPHCKKLLMQIVVQMRIYMLDQHNGCVKKEKYVWSMIT